MEKIEIKNLDPELKKQFEQYCKENDTNFSRYFRNHIKKTLKKWNLIQNSGNRE